MQNYRKIFTEGINADDDFSVHSKGQWINASGIRTFTTDNGATGRVEQVNGMTLLFSTLPEGQNYCMGGCEDEAKTRIVFVNWNSNGNHGIYCYDKVLGAGFKMLMDADVTGGLNISKYAYIHSCFIVNDCFYFTNGIQNQPRRINIESGIKAYDGTFVTSYTAYTLPVTQSIISWIRKPGGLPPVIAKVYQTSPVVTYNSVADGAFQFCYRFNFRGYEISTLSSISKLANYNSKDDTFNRVDVSIPFEESIEQDVLSIDLVVRFAEDHSYFVIKTWDKSITSEAAEITAHNAGTTALTFQFFNDLAGVALDDVYKLKPFESLPIYAYTTELAKNRAFFGNYIIGYNTPKSTSLSVSYSTTNITVGDVSTITGEWFLLHFKVHHPLVTNNYDYYVIQTTNPVNLPLSPAPVYYWKIAAGVPPYPPTLTAGDLTFVGSTIGEMCDWFRANVSGDVGGFASDQTLTDQSDDSSISLSISTSSFLSKAFKSGSNYEVAITFYDEYQRKCGVKKYGIPMSIPDAKVTSNFVAYLVWTLSNTNALTEIPDWAYYYSIDITKCLSTRFFMDGAGFASYVKKDNAGLYQLFNSYSSDQAGVAIDVTSLESFNMGYSYNEGDIARFVISGTEYTLPITGTDGKYIILQLSDVGALSPSMVTFEILTPYKKQVNEPFYETGEMFFVTNPGTSGRIYSILTGHIAGDVYLFKRQFSTATFVAEAMNINDKFWRFWHTDAGRPNAIDVIGQQHITGGRCFSNTFIEGTRTNGLSSFEPLNADVLDEENGAISKLKLASKVQLDGSVLLSICEDECVSTYLGETELFDTKGSPYTAKSDQVLGSTRALKGSMGTRNPESVFEFNGLVFYYDVRNGCFVQYADSGLFPISKNKFVRPAKLFSKKYETLSAIDIEELGSRPFVIGGFDPYHKEALFTIPTTERIPPKGVLEDYATAVAGDYTVIGTMNPWKISLTTGGLSTIFVVINFTAVVSGTPISKQGYFNIGDQYMTDYSTGSKTLSYDSVTIDSIEAGGLFYPYDIYDGQGKTLVYKHEADMWFGSLPFESEKFIKMGNDLYAFKNGALYQCNTGTPCNFFGTQYTAKIMYANNPGAIHTFLSIGLESNKKPSFVHCRTEDPYTQSSDLADTDFVNKEGVLSASLFRDRLSPNVSGVYNKKMMSGDRLFGKALLTMLEYEFVNDTSKLQLRISDVGNVIRKGTLINQQ
jgi:hypothetical protein